MSNVNFQQEFEAKLLELFPDVANEGIASRKQLVEVMDALGTTKYPTWLMHNKVGRGLYAIAGGQVVEVQEKEEKVSFAAPVETKSLIPTKDRNYVAFGNHKHVELIVKSGLFYPTYITGPTGNGKSTMVEQVCAAK